LSRFQALDDLTFLLQWLLPVLCYIYIMFLKGKQTNLSAGTPLKTLRLFQKVYCVHFPAILLQRKTFSKINCVIIPLLVVEFAFFWFVTQSPFPQKIISLRNIGLIILYGTSIVYYMDMVIFLVIFAFTFENSEKSSF